MQKSTLIKIAVCGTLLSFSAPAYAQCAEEQLNLDNLQREYGVLFLDLEQQGIDLKKALPDSTSLPSASGHHISGEIKFKKQNISFNLIEVTMKLQKMSLDLPQVTMKTKSFSIPTSKTEWKVTNIGFGIKTKTLVITNGMKRVSFKFPETKMGRTEIATKIPQFTSKRKDIILTVPQFKVNSPIPEEGQTKDLEEKSKIVAKQAEELNSTGIRLEREQKDKAKVYVANLFTCVHKDLEAQKITANSSFTSELMQIDAAIREVGTQGLNPSQLKSDDGTVTDLVKERATLVATQAESMKSIDDAITQLDVQLASVMAELNS